MPKNADDILDFKPPTPEAFALLVAPLYAYFSPVFYGLENVDEKTPHLFVCNHTIYGLLDVPLVYDELYRKKGFFLRSMADHAHYSVPVWRSFVKWSGGVPGTRENCKKLMKAGENIAIVPGGGREVCKRKGEAYKLIWKKRLGFVRLAVEHNYPIMPFAMVGVDNAFSIIIDRNDFMNSSLGKFMKRVGLLNIPFLNDENIFPIARGIGVTPIPRPERIYVSFGEPIDTTPFKGKHKDNKALLELRDIVENSITNQIRELLLKREQDTDKGIIRRFLTRL